MPQKYLSVTDLNLIIKERLEEDVTLQRIYLKGEISNWKVYRSGAFFDLSDGESLIPCTIWSNNLDDLNFKPEDGLEVLAFGNVSVYHKRGRYSFSILSMSLFGAGANLLALEELKKKLQKEGLFDESRKKPLPSFPTKIGAVCAKGSAASADILENAYKRWPLADIYLFPSLVQGQEAPKELIKAVLKAIDEEVDILIIARGGGSVEDLSAFNDEKLVRTLASCPIPTIAAVGHEIDFTLVDFVADVRVSTPTAAAVRATPNKEDIRNALNDYETSLDEAIGDLLERKREKLASLANRPFFKDPSYSYSRVKERVSSLSKRLEVGMTNILASKRKDLENISNHLEAINPNKVLERGYALTLDEGGKPITSINDVKKGQITKTKMKDGYIVSEVKETKNGD